MATLTSQQKAAMKKQLDQMSQQVAQLSKAVQAKAASEKSSSSTTSSSSSKSSSSSSSTGQKWNYYYDKSGTQQKYFGTKANADSWAKSQGYTTTKTPQTGTPTSGEISSPEKAKIESELAEAKNKLTSIQDEMAILEKAKSLGMPFNASTKSSEAKTWLANYEQELEEEPEEEPEEIKSSIPMTNVEIGGVNFSIPTELYNDPFYNAANDEMKAIMANSWDAVVNKGHDIGTLTKALDVAAKQSDVYMRQQIRMFETELLRSFTELGQDLDMQKELYTRRLDELQEDLARGKEHLTIDQQRELRDVEKQYKQNLEQTREGMAERGLTRSTIRSRAEDMLAESKSDIVESTTDKYQRQVTQIETQAGRQKLDLGTQVEELHKRISSGAINLLRQGEAELGTDAMKNLNLPQLGLKTGGDDWMAADHLVGDISGDIKTKQTQDILSRVGGLIGT
jgi:hypothetical protein